MFIGIARVIIATFKSGVGVVSNWILATGFWNDGGVWDDNESWND